MKVHWRLSALVLFCSICVTLSILYYRTQVHHASLSPFDLWLFSCQTSIRIENIPTVTEDERAAMLPRPQHPAIKISASELLEASTEQLRRQYGSKIIHQSWKTHDISSSHYAPWRPEETWSTYHPADEGWYYVLWSNEDNQRLVETKFPEYLELYQSFTRDIMRADFIRPLYMAAFGGVYADLDLLPLSNLGEHLAFDPLASPMKAWPAKMDVVGWKASLQRYSMPNAFLAASGPGHPFWIHYVDDIRYHWAMADIDFSSVETVTGPIALWRSANVWHDQENAVLEVLTPGRIYPFTWNSYRHGERCVCLAGREPEFDPQRCNLLFPDAWTITYWQSGWM